MLSVGFSFKNCVFDADALFKKADFNVSLLRSCLEKHDKNGMLCLSIKAATSTTALSCDMWREIRRSKWIHFRRGKTINKNLKILFELLGGCSIVGLGKPRITNSFFPIVRTALFYYYFP